MKRTGLTMMVILLMAMSSSAQYFLDSKQLYLASAAELQLYANALGFSDSMQNINGVEIFKLRYNTVDVFGNPTIASGALYVPQVSCDTLPLLSYQHGTVMDYRKVPSRRSDDLTGYFFGGSGYITVMPDYLGLGDNPGIHPYIHWESEATASIDLIRAAREFLNDSLKIWDNGQLFISGYSQGGHATMAMHKYIQIHNLKEEFNVVASSPMSGPYSLYHDQMNLILNEDSTYYKSIFLPYIFASYNLVYGNLYTDYTQYYDPPFDSLIASWDSSGIYLDHVSSDIFPLNYYHFMQDSVLDHIIENPNHPVNVALRENDLHNWAPQEPVRMLYCEMDSMVSPQNSLTALDTMTALGAPDVKAINVYSLGDHGSCALPAYFYTLAWFDSLAVKCSPAVNLPEFNNTPGFKVYPNPTSGLITIETAEPDLWHIEIISLNGQTVLSRNLEGPTLQMDLSAYKRGVYFITISSDKYTVTRKIIKL
ncbi:MAG: T9SS type A sorting domain-containing protein [Bacteroidota bacterium]